MSCCSWLYHVFSGFLTTLLNDNNTGPTNEQEATDTLNSLIEYLQLYRELIKTGDVSQNEIWRYFALNVEKDTSLTIDKKISALAVLAVILADQETSEDFFWLDSSDRLEMLDAFYQAYSNNSKQLSAIYTAAQTLTYQDNPIPIEEVVALMQLTLGRISMELHNTDTNTSTVEGSDTSVKRTIKPGLFSSSENREPRSTQPDKADQSNITVTKTLH